MSTSIKTTRNKTVIRAGSQSVITSDPSRAQNQEIARFLFPEMSDAIDAIMAPIYKQGRSKWPRPGKDASGRSTGRSYNEFQYDVFISGKGVLTGRIRNPAVNLKDGYPYPYSAMYKGGAGKTYWSRDFTKPFRKSKKKTLDSLMDTYRALLERADG